MPSTLEELRRDPELLFERLCGAVHAGPGLLARAAERVEELGYEPGPGYRSGSITGMLDQHHEDSTDEAKVFTLYLGLRQWLGQPCDSVTEASRLRFQRLTDVEALLGNPKKKHEGLLMQAWLKVKWLLERAHNEDHIDQCEALEEALSDWLENRCTHALAVVASDSTDISHLLCSMCGARVNQDRKGNWLAV